MFFISKNSASALSQVTPEEGGAPKISTLATPRTSKHYTQHIHHMMYICVGRFTYRIGYLILRSQMKT